MKVDPLIIDAAQSAQKQWHIPASVSVAQWALESGWGAHSPGNNPFGIKALPGYATQNFATHEVVKGHLVPCTQTFAAFPSIAAAFVCHAKLLATSSYYATAMKALPDLAKFIPLMAAHYATDPQYAAKIQAIIGSSDLTQFDKVPA